MVTIPKEALEGIRNRETLFAFLRDRLKWPVTPDDTFTYDIPIVGKTQTKADVSRIIPFSAEDPFAIILVEFQVQFNRADLRELLREIRARIRKERAFEGRGLEEIIFVCATPGYDGIRFAHFTQQEGRQPKLSVFGWDRLSIDETRTLREFNLPSLEMPGKDMFDAWLWSEALPRWMEAWDIEKVTNAFYKEYNRLFKLAEEKIEGFVGADDKKAKDDKRLFTQKLFNRLLFVRFLERKRWLPFNGRHDYLCALWEDYREKRDQDSNFYTSRLKLLFFSGLNNEQETNLMRINGGGLLSDLIGDVPYLNGGLFDEQEDEDQNKQYPGISVPDDAIEPIIAGLFYDYNFTVTESTPDDIEVAVDPEMLGKVFEELVTGRHESGSYYTPKGVVSFMCREALKGYIRNAVPQESADAVERFVDLHDPEALTNPEAILDALRRIKVCDPACGSGAYLLGMLHELMELRTSLFKSKQIDPISAYKKKLEIIQGNVYGVDIDPFAVNIARLRLWLSLTVEYDGPEPEPLPNLDFKIECGDSVVGYFPEHRVELDNMMLRSAVDEYRQKKEAYLKAHGTEKIALKAKAMALREEIGVMLHPNEPIPSFDWIVDFAEVFTVEDREVGGFDVVLANPPYIRQELIKDQKPALKKTYGDLYCGTADLYVYFYMRAIQMLKDGGMLVFISSNKWFKADYGEKLRKEIARCCHVWSIVDFGDLPVFNATAYPMIFTAQKGHGGGPTVLAQVKSLENPYPDVLAVVRKYGQVLPEDAIKASDWSLTDAATADRLRKMEKAGIPLGEYVNGRIYYGIKTGFNTAFVIDGAKRDELVRKDPKSAEIIKPLAMGKDIKRWHVDFHDRWLILTKIGVDIKRYPAVFAHLRQWQSQLEERWDKGEHWWELRACAYYDDLDKPKIIFPDIAAEARFAFDTTGAYLGNTAYIIPVADMFLLGVLNSRPVEDFYIQLSAQVRGGYLRFIRQYVEQIPIPDASDADEKAISDLVQKCLDAKGVDCEQWEREIDQRVAALYGL